MKLLLLIIVFLDFGCVAQNDNSLGSSFVSDPVKTILILGDESNHKYFRYWDDSSGYKVEFLDVVDSSNGLRVVNEEINKEYHICIIAQGALDATFEIDANVATYESNIWQQVDGLKNICGKTVVVTVLKAGFEWIYGRASSIEDFNNSLDRSYNNSSFAIYCDANSREFEQISNNSIEYSSDNFKIISQDIFDCATGRLLF